MDRSSVGLHSQVLKVEVERKYLSSLLNLDMALGQFLIREPLIVNGAVVRKRLAPLVYLKGHQRSVW